MSVVDAPSSAAGEDRETNVNAFSTDTGGFDWMFAETMPFDPPGSDGQFVHEHRRPSLDDRDMRLAIRPGERDGGAHMPERGGIFG